jgi:hypothetical protein
VQSVRPIAIDLIRVGERLRQVDQERVAAIGASIDEIGLQMPISVFPSQTYEDGVAKPCFELVAGLHRLMAARALGWTEISASLVELNEIDRGIWECDENLARSELTSAPRARFTARRKELYEIKHPETRPVTVRGGPGRGKTNEKSAPVSAPTFTEDTAKKSRQSQRTIQIDARRGEKIDPEVLKKIEGTEHDKGTVLDKLARLEPKEQRQALKRLEAGKPIQAQAVPKQRDQEFAMAKAALLRAWQKAPLAARAWFRDFIVGDGADETA